jgi:mono/diheme cytochrome c family protein
MNNAFRACVLSAVVALFAHALSFAQFSGEAICKDKCLVCHGPTGLANSGIGKIMKVKLVTDPSVRNMSLPGMIRVTEKGMGKMQGYKNDLTDAQIREVVVYFRALIK